jgi:hypothetical protein
VCVLRSVAKKTLQLLELMDEHPELHEDILDFWGFDLRYDIFDGLIRPSTALSYVNRLFNRDDSRWRAVLLDEVSKLPKDSEEREEQENKLRHLNFGMNERKLSDITDLLSLLRIDVISMMVSEEDRDVIPVFKHSYRPDMPEEAAAETKTDDFDPATLKGTFRALGVL